MADFAPNILKWSNDYPSSCPQRHSRGGHGIAASQHARSTVEKEADLGHAGTGRTLAVAMDERGIDRGMHTTVEDSSLFSRSLSMKTATIPVGTTGHNGSLRDG